MRGIRLKLALRLKLVITLQSYSFTGLPGLSLLLLHQKHSHHTTPHPPPPTPPPPLVCLRSPSLHESFIPPAASGAAPFNPSIARLQSDHDIYPFTYLMKSASREGVWLGPIYVLMRRCGALSRYGARERCLPTSARTAAGRPARAGPPGVPGVLEAFRAGASHPPDTSKPSVPGWLMKTDACGWVPRWVQQP
ncbi:hypothetical protein F4780DRAFT_413258 [Xylariomycetidae sp. FL0641]|nr:hypothetical protein F4780DRAFT_413258 [Xylariomycetidae sp. FL0641]